MPKIMKKEMRKMNEIIRGFTRVSSTDYHGKDQAEIISSIRTQTARIEGYCEVNKLPKPNYFYTKDIDHSAYLKDDKFSISFDGTRMEIKIDLSHRPGFVEMLNDAKKHLFNILLITRWDRLFRSAVLHQLAPIYLESLGVKVIATDDSNDPVAMRFTGVINEQEPIRTAKRMEASFERRFNEGSFSGKAPYGYRFDKKTRTIKVYDKEAEIIRKAFDLTLNGHKYSDICRATGLGASSYYNIIKNITYTGKVTYKKQVKQGKHEAIISQELFDKVKNLMSS
jgi:DNA invertase Pin-like site-specific DNA recombinase